MTDKSPTLTCATQPPSSQPEVDPVVTSAAPPDGVNNAIIAPPANAAHFDTALDFGGGITGEATWAAGDADIDFDGWGGGMGGAENASSITAVGGGNAVDFGGGGSEGWGSTFGGGVTGLDEGFAVDTADIDLGVGGGGPLFGETPNATTAVSGDQGGGWNDWDQDASIAIASTAPQLPPPAPAHVLAPVEQHPVASSQMLPPRVVAPAAVVPSTALSTPSKPSSAVSSPQTMSRRISAAPSLAETPTAGATPTSVVESPLEPSTVEKAGVPILDTPPPNPQAKPTQQQSVGAAFRSMQKTLPAIPATPVLGTQQQGSGSMGLGGGGFRQMKEYTQNAKDLEALLLQGGGGSSADLTRTPSPKTQGGKGAGGSNKLETVATLREARARESDGNALFAAMSKNTSSTLMALGPQPALGSLVLGRPQVPLPKLLPQVLQYLEREIAELDEVMLATTRAEQAAPVAKFVPSTAAGSGSLVRMYEEGMQRIKEGTFVSKVAPSHDTTSNAEASQGEPVVTSSSQQPRTHASQGYVHAQQPALPRRGGDNSNQAEEEDSMPAAPTHTVTTSTVTVEDEAVAAPGEEDDMPTAVTSSATQLLAA